MAHIVCNPIVPGFSPDPSIVYVDNTFFLVTSSFHIFPGIPIYASKNLKSWTHIGNAINKNTQLSLESACTGSRNSEEGNSKWAFTGGLFAPTIRFNKGTYYIICTNCKNGAEAWILQNFYVTTTDIWSGEWSDPIYYNWNLGFDPSLFFDDDGRVYVQGNWVVSLKERPSTTIKQAEIDIATGKLLSEPKEIWQGDSRWNTEGPHIYKRDGFYYCIVAEGGTHDHHMISVGRSANIWGPFESYVNNPILTAYGKDEYVQFTGHADMFEDGEGLWWAACLGVRMAPGDRFALSRETFLTSVVWTDDGWPILGQIKMSFKRESKTLAINNLELVYNPRIDDVFIRNPVLDDYEFSSQGIRIAPSSQDLSTPTGTCSFLGKRQRALECTATTTIIINEDYNSQNVKAGLSVYKDSIRHAEIFYDYQYSTISFSFVNEINSISHSITAKDVLEGEYYELQICATEMEYTFLYRRDKDDEWTQLQKADVLDMNCRDFTGPIFGIFTSKSADIQGGKIEFTDFKVF